MILLAAVIYTLFLPQLRLRPTPRAVRQPPLLSAANHAANAVDAEVVPAAAIYAKAPPASGTVLSEEAIDNVFTLVWRDTRMLSKTATQRPLPIYWDELRARLPTYRWFVAYKADQYKLALAELRGRLEPAQRIPAVARGLDRQQASLRRRIDYSRSTLWPTLRTLLLSRSVHQRVLEAARTQVVEYADQSSSDGGGALLASSPRRLLSLWAGLVRYSTYGLRWLFAIYWPLFSAERRQRARTRLIESALAYGVELQRRVEAIEDARRLLPSGAARREPRLAGRGGAAAAAGQRGWRAAWTGAWARLARGRDGLLVLLARLVGRLPPVQGMKPPITG